MFRLLSAAWGVLGVVLMLVYAIYRLFLHTMAAFEYELSLLQWLVLLVNIAFMAYSEGYKGFQLAFSPRVAARALYLSKQANWLNGILAPLFCFGYFGTTRKRQLSAYILTVMVIILVILVSYVPQPWRGVIDAGVVVGLLWGVTSLTIFSWQAFFQADFAYSPELSARLQS